MINLKGLKVYSKNSLETKLFHDKGMKLCFHDKAIKSIFHVKVALGSKHVYQTAQCQCKT